MIEEIIKNWLNTELRPIKAYLESQKNMPKEYVLIEKTGSNGNKGFYHATIVIQSYAESMYKAAKLSKKVRKLMQNIVQLDEISSVLLNSEYNFTDTETKQYRYQAVFDVKYYEEV